MFNQPPPTDAAGVPIIGQPTVLHAIVAIMLKCTCDVPLQGVLGSVFKCKCGRQWLVNGGLNIQTTGVVVPEKTNES